MLFLKYKLIKFIEKQPLLQIFIYNNLEKFKFLFPHDKDYFALKLIFQKDEKRDFLDVGGNIGLSSIGFRELGFKDNRILIFEPDINLINKYLKKIKKLYRNIKIFSFGLSNTDTKMKLYKAFYKNKHFHFNNSFSKKYIINKIKDNYPENFKKFKYQSFIYSLKRFDKLNIKSNACFVKIDVEGLDHLVIYGMINFIKKNKPVLLIEYNQINFSNIYNSLKNFYDCYLYDFEKNKLKKLTKEIKLLKKGKILEKKYKKNSVNIFFINKYVAKK